MTTDRIRRDILVTPAELEAFIEAGEPVVILDARFEKSAGNPWPPTGTESLPGAIHVDIASEFAAPSLPGEGNRPLPDIAVLENNARSWGIDDDSIVVVYGDNKTVQAARAWWVLRWAGVQGARLLDGGFKAWTAAGLPVTTHSFAPPVGFVALSPGHLPVVDGDGAASIAKNGILLDARAKGPFADGHIPGAVNAPSAGNLRDDGTFEPGDVLAASYRSLGVDGNQAVAAYCGSAIAAAHDIVALKLAGLDASLYPGSFSAWSSDPARPIETGYS